jgi:hypothetical protein
MPYSFLVETHRADQGAQRVERVPRRRYARAAPSDGHSRTERPRANGSSVREQASAKSKPRRCGTWGLFGCSAGLSTVYVGAHPPFLHMRMTSRFTFADGKSRCT